ncbi:uncharacterized protein LOC142220320 isoform X1 [Haematobia irritans]|uniref:uncharacterized protein LOC142220320 isoform X1 n=1 Tax=Haematobia irritans TaxID=7368 RepID=UPI003F4FA0F3
MSKSKRNFYEILNASPNATFEELKTNYKNLILQCHPDKLQQQQQQQQHHETIDKLENDLNNKEFVGITEAWNCLKDPSKRKCYDAELLLNKFHTHSNIYAHIQLNEMKKCLSTNDEFELNRDDEGGENHKGNAIVEEAMKSDSSVGAESSSSYIYTYDCRCGGQYIVDESAEQYCCRKVNSTAGGSGGKSSTVDDGGTHDDADMSPNNKNSKTDVHALADGGGPTSRRISEDLEEEDDESDNELIVECSECSLVIVING